MGELCRRLASETLLGDGGFGWRALARARELECSVEELCLCAPAFVAELHAQDAAAGARSITTDSFCADQRAAPRELARASAELARPAARWLVGTIGPGTGASGTRARALRRVAVREVIGGLLAGGVDALLVETARETDDALATLRDCAALASDLPRFLAVTPDHRGRLADGRPFEELIERALGDSARPYLIALNCIPAEPAARPIVERLARAVGDGAQLGLWPNAGVVQDGRAPIPPTDFAAFVAACVGERRFALLGGCCGCGPAHIAALARHLPAPCDEPMQRVLEPEVMDTVDEAAEYDAMDHSAANESFVTRLVALGARGRMLDIGTGPGHIPLLVAERIPGAHIVAVDLAETMLARAREKLARAPRALATRIEFRRADAKGLEFPDAAFDTVYSNTILHHIPEPGAFLREARRVLRPGGCLLIRDLFRPVDEARADELVARHAVEATPAQRALFRASLCAALTTDELRALARAAGWTDAEVVVDSDRHHSLQRAAR